MRSFVEAFLDYWLDLRKANGTAPDAGRWHRRAATFAGDIVPFNEIGNRALVIVGCKRVGCSPEFQARLVAMSLVDILGVQAVDFGQFARPLFDHVFVRLADASRVIDDFPGRFRGLVGKLHTA